MDATLGRVLFYRPAAGDPGWNGDDDQRYTATVAHVHGASSVNLGVLDAVGAPFNRTSVSIAGAGLVPPPGSAEWPPYTQGLAPGAKAADPAGGTTASTIDGPNAADASQT